MRSSVRLLCVPVRRLREFAARLSAASPRPTYGGSPAPDAPLSGAAPSRTTEAVDSAATDASTVERAWVADGLDTPLEGVYPFHSTGPEEAIVLHEGPMEIAGATDSVGANGRVMVRVVDGLDLRWDFDGDVPWGEPVRLRFHRADGSRADVPAEVTSSAGSGYIQHAEILASQPGTFSGPAEPELSYVLTHWFNMPSFLPTSPLAVANTVFAGRWEFAAHGWRLTLDQRPDHGDALRVAKYTKRSTMTHVGKLERDAGTFSVPEAKEVLHALETAASFAVGAWVGVALPVGYDQSNRRVWEEWANWRCSPPGSVFPWWSTHRSQDLHELCAAFLRHWLDPQLKDAVRFSSFHSISASTDRATLEAKVTVAQAGIEYLAWVTNVLEGREDPKRYERVPAEKKLHEYLRVARVSDEIPAEFIALRRLAPQDRQTGPQAVTWVRNRVVHPKDASEPYRIENALSEAWLLCREYLDLMILHRLGYTGQYVPYRPNGWTHDAQQVPWQVGQSRP